MRKITKKTSVFQEKRKAFRCVRILPYSCPSTTLLCSDNCPNEKIKKRRATVRLLPEYNPNTARLLSARNRKKQTTPFGGMARPYYSFRTPIFYSFSHLSLVPYSLLLLAPLKHSQEHC